MCLSLSSSAEDCSGKAPSRNFLLLEKSCAGIPTTLAEYCFAGSESRVEFSRQALLSSRVIWKHSRGVCVDVRFVSLKLIGSECR